MFFRILSFFVIFFFNAPIFGQSDGTLLIVVTSDAKIKIDGLDTGSVVADQPFKLKLNQGEHYVQAEGILNGQKAEATEIVTIEPEKQKVLKMELKPSVTNNSSSVITNSILSPITIADLSFNLAGSFTVNAWKNDHPNQAYTDNPSYFYAFEKGDEIVLNFSMNNTKGTNIIFVSAYPEMSVKYSNNSFVELKDVHIKVEDRGIYWFHLATNFAFDRQCKMSISRIPASEASKNFNSTVKRVKKYTAQTIQSPEEFFINSGSNATFYGGKSRITLPLNFPKNTVEWYYKFSASRDQTEISQTKQKLNLVSELTGLVGGLSGGLLNIGIGQLTSPPGSDYCDVYLLDKDNFSPFEAKTEFMYKTAGTRENFKSGTVQIKCCMNDTYYIGIKNPDSMYGVHVVIEIVAVVVSEYWAMEQQ